MLFIYIDCHVGVPPRNDDELDGVRFLGCARNDNEGKNMSTIRPGMTKYVD